MKGVFRLALQHPLDTSASVPLPPHTPFLFNASLQLRISPQSKHTRLYHAVSWGGGEKKKQQPKNTANTTELRDQFLLSECAFCLDTATAPPATRGNITGWRKVAEGRQQQRQRQLVTTWVDPAGPHADEWSQALDNGLEAFFFCPSPFWISGEFERTCVCGKKEKTWIKDTQQQSEERAARSTAH